MMALSPAERNKLIGILGMLGSEFRDEVATAGSMATNLVRKHGLTWDDVVPPALTSSRQIPQGRRPTGEAAAGIDMRFCQRHLDKLNTWEREFIQSLSRRCKFTDGRIAKLKQIAAGLRMRGCA